MGNVYEGELPVADEWAGEHAGETWTFRFAVNLYELIVCEGIDRMNDLTDDVTGVILGGLVYKVGRPGPDDVQGNSVVIEATGEVVDVD